MAKRIWIRRDSETGDIEEISEDNVRTKITGYYHDTKKALANASSKAPLSTGYAEYYPKA